MPILRRYENPIASAIRTTLIGEEPESFRGRVGSVLADVLGATEQFEPEQAMLTPAYLNAAQRAALEALGATSGYLRMASRVPRKVGQQIKEITTIPQFLKKSLGEETIKTNPTATLKAMRWRGVVEPLKGGEGYMVGLRRSKPTPGQPYVLPEEAAETYLHEAGHVFEKWMGNLGEEAYRDWLSAWRAANRMPTETVEKIAYARNTMLSNPAEILAEAFATYKMGSPLFKEFPETIRHMVKKYAKRAR